VTAGPAAGDPAPRQRWRYAELELRFARGHERPTRIRWSPPDPAQRATVGRPADPDPLAAMLAHLGGVPPEDGAEVLEVDLLGAIGERGWRLVASRVQQAGSGEARSLTFVRPA
jgi:hypothetical protein